MIITKEKLLSVLIKHLGKNYSQEDSWTYEFGHYRITYAFDKNIKDPTVVNFWLDIDFPNDKKLRQKARNIYKELGLKYTIDKDFTDSDMFKYESELLIMSPLGSYRKFLNL